MTTLNSNVVSHDIPSKRYFTIGEVSELCDVKTHVLRYWEQEFTQLNPVKRRGNRRYYQQQDVLLIQMIRDLLHGQGFTIQGAKQQLQSLKEADVGVMTMDPHVDHELIRNTPQPSVAPMSAGGLSDVIHDLEAIVQLLSH